ncbi:hypothetical protein [Methylophaga sp. OBS3]|uniref:hypothetical protein n=1 Tax=Methylophaga sp. OBS3 TaxID=2991934 RepID=UPI00225AC9E7|nr:hypothetical protein [Methylophaga sp. OBS3]MCX4190833.1 hypothetical protein [Methylophaga sp. OBS3]
MTNKNYILKSLGLGLLILLSGLFLIFAQFIYLGSVASFVDKAMQLSIVVVLLLNLLALFCIVKKHLRKALWLVLTANGIAIFFSIAFLNDINKDMYQKEVAAYEKGYRERLLAEYDNRVICGDIGFYSEHHDWGGRHIRVIYPETFSVAPRSIASFMHYSKGQYCKVNTSITEDLLGKCDAAAREQVMQMVTELENLPCPYPTIR